MLLVYYDTSAVKMNRQRTIFSRQTLLPITVDLFTNCTCFILVIGKKLVGVDRGYTRREIQEKLWDNLSDEKLEKNVSGDAEYGLHHYESCTCENGVIGKQKKAAANKTS